MEKIKSALPEVLQIVMFYNNGTVFQTTFDQSKNIPKLGENLAESLAHARKLFEFCQIDTGAYKKLVYETKEITLIILKLGENSNIALFLKNLKEEDLNYQSIRRYLYRIERLIDMDKIDLEKEELKEKQAELDKMEGILTAKLSELENMKSNLSALANEIEKKTENLKIKEKELENGEKELEKIKEEMKIKETETDKKKMEEIKEKTGKDKEILNEIKSELKKIEDNKVKLSSEIEKCSGECEVLKKDIALKKNQFLELKEKIEKEEKEKFEEKFLE